MKFVDDHDDDDLGDGQTNIDNSLTGFVCYLNWRFVLQT